MKQEKLTRILQEIVSKIAACALVEISEGEDNSDLSIHVYNVPEKLVGVVEDKILALNVDFPDVDFTPMVRDEEVTRKYYSNLIPRILSIAVRDLAFQLVEIEGDEWMNSSWDSLLSVVRTRDQAANEELALAA